VLEKGPFSQNLAHEFRFGARGAVGYFGGVHKWALLTAAIAIEVAATLSLRAAQDHSAWLVLVVVGYVGALLLLTIVLRAGMPVGVAYGIWGAMGTAGTAVLAAIIFDDPFTWPIVAGIGLIIAGVLLVEFGSQRAADEPTP
jgi:small multidrug resistance pump